jgi:tyrosyl-tRNA synthetase
MPILPGVDGAEKMSKSLGNHVGVAEPPEEQFGKTMRLPDDAMESWFSLLAVPRPPEGTGPRDTKRALARGIVARFHGDDAAAAAEQHFERLFVTHEAPEEVAEHGFVPANGAVHLPALIAEAFGRSRSEARRLLAQGGVKLDGEALGEADMDVAPERLDGHVLQLGKRHFRRLRLTS